MTRIDGKEKPVEEITPFDISTQEPFSDTFGNFETEAVARDIVQFCREAGGWAPFTRAEIASVQARRTNKRTPPEELLFYFLTAKLESDDSWHYFGISKKPSADDDGWIKKVSNTPETFVVSKEFILRCYHSGLRRAMRRAENPNEGGF